jgi:hypothetical protein
MDNVGISNMQKIGLKNRKIEHRIHAIEWNPEKTNIALPEELTTENSKEDQIDQWVIISKTPTGRKSYQQYLRESLPAGVFFSGIRKLCHLPLAEGFNCRGFQAYSKRNMLYMRRCCGERSLGSLTSLLRSLQGLEAGKTLGVYASPLGHSIMAKQRGDRSTTLASTCR